MSLMRNAAFNFLGAAVPALLAIATIPYIVSVLGAADYGLLALITSIVGYFALLDINITASSTKYVSEFNASGDTQRLNETICFGLLIYGGIGLIGMTGIYFSSHYLVIKIFTVPLNRQLEAITAIQIAALGFLIGQLQAYIQSLPGALMRFDISGRMEAVFGIIIPLSTIALLYFGYGLVELVWLRVGMSFIQACLLWRIIHNILPKFQWSTPSQDIKGMMLSFSAYSFLSRLAALSYSNADKLIISAKVGVVGLTYYVVPSTLANRVMSLIFRLSGVMFPHASALAAQGRLAELEKDYLLASRYLFFINGSIAIVLSTLAYPILSLWLSPEFANTGASVMVMIALAQWIDSITNLPTLVNDALGHPKVSGLFAIAHAIIGLVMIFFGVREYGIIGAAGAHLISSLIMTLAFILYVHGRTVPITLNTLFLHAFKPSLFVLVLSGILGGLLMELAKNSWLHLILSAGLMGTVLLVGGSYFVCTSDHRKKILGWCQSKLEGKIRNA